MRTTALTAVFGLLLLAAMAVGGKEKPLPPPPTAPAAQPAPADPAIKKMIDDLGSDDWRTREKAGADLTLKGEKALAQMRAALLASDSPEVQRRLSVLVRKIDRERLTEPKRVTYSAKDKSPKQVFDEIAKQTGYRIDFSGDGSDAKYSFEFDKTPFWQAVDAVANAGGYTVYAEYDDESIRVYSQGTTNPYVAYGGPFRFLATNINTSRSVQLSGIAKRGGRPPVNEYMNLSFQVQSEPKNPMLGIMQPELTEAKDDLGGSLLPPQDRNGYRSSNYYSSGYRGHNTYMSVNLLRGNRDATTLKSLKGRVTIVLLAGTVPDVVVDDPLKAKKKSFAGRSVTLDVESVEEDANQKGQYVVNVTAKRTTPVDPNRGDDYAWSNNLWQKIELTDASGNKYFSYGPQQHDNNGGTVKMVIQYGLNNRRTGQPGDVKLGPPTRLVVTEWLTANHEVKFEFKDIPLP